MGSQWLTLDVCSVAEVVASLERPETVERVTEAVRPAVLRLAQRDYQRDPKTWQHADADLLIQALREVTALLSNGSQQIELHADEDETPELWDFIWSEWEPSDALQLPLSPHGVPAVTYKDSTSAARYAERFKALRARGGYARRKLAPTQLDALVAALDEAANAERGLFAYYEL
jgi:hypothetical protein